MKKRILLYRMMIDEMLKSSEMADGELAVDWELLKERHLTQISFFQHERLIHLIVTVLFALMEIMSFILSAICPGIGTFALNAALLILLIPYIKHYYLLENEVQKMYDQYDRIIELADRAASRTH